jgi:hypothetical protein
LQLGGTSQAGRHFRAVEIGAKADAVLADMFQNMFVLSLYLMPETRKIKIWGPLAA